ncbi:MAG: hypothetical protein M1830_005069 [Pleopsidium flavum]|nr:MAG: hypothetical protein M1830_005069 [Pleopsidium flavum]
MFCHSLIRLCMLIIHPPTDEEQGLRVANRTGAGGFAQPEQPIRVVLARDEEIGISGTGDYLGGSKDQTIPPPAQQKADPNLLHWQHAMHPAFRQDAADGEGAEDRPATANRPPSYISNESVSYDAALAAG